VPSCVTCQDGDVPFSFLAGNPALDFVATVASRDSVAYEWLPDPSALAEWIKAASDTAELSAPVSSSAFRQALELREIVYAALRDRADGREVAPERLAAINAAAAHPTPVPLLQNRTIGRRGGVHAFLALLARAAQEALIDDRLRFCDGSDCTRPFIDTSRAGNRRWCGMAGCGDRAKALTYRRRAKSPQTPAGS
jgi:predicted RNA-binding Zn ribbon-like protein